MYGRKEKAMIYIYGIFIREECYYIGQTNNVDRRFSQHREAIIKKEHSVKALNKFDIDDIEMRVIAEINTDNSLIIMLTEALYNSIYKPKNGIVWQSGRNTVRFKRIDVELAERLLDVLSQDVLSQDVLGEVC